MVRSHYNQKARLEQFTRKEGNKSKLTYVDLQRKKIGSRNTKSAFVEEGLYSDELENELNIKIEIPGMDVFRKVYNSESSIILTRKDLEIVKKYLLIQNYRNPQNIRSYNPGHESDILHFNDRFKNGEESSREFVFRMMQEILDHPWTDLIYSKEPEVRENVRQHNGRMTLFVRSDFEFVINDLGHVTERQYWDVFDNKQFRLDLRRQLSKMGKKVTNNQITRYVGAHHYHDNFTFYPISKHFGIIILDELWTTLIKQKQAYVRIAGETDNYYDVYVNELFFEWMR